MGQRGESRAIVAAVTALVCVAAVQPPKGRTATPEQAAFFESKVRPTLLGKCVPCHGPDAAQGGLRLDRAIDPAMARKVAAAIAYDGAVKMPPSGKLPVPEVEALGRWAAEGAPWPAPVAAPPGGGGNHWSFQPVKRPAAPGLGLVENPVDAFVQAKRVRAGLPASPPADRRTLIRRVTYDLIGLPPTPEEVDAFVKDASPDAYERLVDRLLASPHYGEKWARHWLDLVRYAETNSYERDNPKPQPWRYRDYVIRSFNQDKSYWRFVREQLAGDELVDGGADGLIATGFYRLGIWDDEAVDAEQARYDGIDDIVTTVGQTFLGLTLDCARCHNHKIDPIPQADYYRFVAFFQGINHFKNGGPTDEKPILRTRAEEKAYEADVATLVEKRTRTAGRIAAIEDEYRARRDASPAAGDLADVRWRRYAGAFDRLPDFDKLPGEASGASDRPLVDLTAARRPGGFGAVFEASLKIPGDGEYVFFLDSDDGSRLSVDGKRVVDFDGPHGEGQERTGKLALKAGTVALRIDYFQGPGESPLGLRLAWQGPGVARRPLSTASSISPLGVAGQLALDGKRYLLSARFAERERLLKEKEALDKAEPAFDKALCITEGGKTPGDTFILARGVASAKGAKVEAGFPSCAGGGAAAPVAVGETSGRRRALAEWIVDPKNPLTARVIVNRIWQHHFGKGLVRTPNDYGLQGARPTHPELLDWLASEFVRRGGSFKQMHRLLVTSQTYRMASRAIPAALKKDPDNELLWRFNPRRLEAEEVRDSILAVSGNLNRALFGPPVYPDIQKEVLQGQSIPGYGWHPEQMSERDKCRRSIYIHVKRSLLYPVLESFDLAETDRTTPVRFASTQPTQALSLFNGPFGQQQALVLSARVTKETGAEPVAFCRRVVSLVTQRPPTVAEVDALTSLLLRLQKRGASAEQARQGVCLTALNLNEFLYLD